MKVILKRPWFNGRLYRPEPGGIDVPDNLRDKLPKDAKVVGEEPKSDGDDDPKTDLDPKDPKSKSKTKLDL